MATLSLAAFLGNLISYKIGARVSEKINSQRYGWVNQNALEKTHLFYAKYWKLALFISPFIAVVRTFAPFLAGVGNMPYSQYVASSTIGSTFWVVSLTLAGYVFGNILFILNHMASITLLGLCVGIACLVVSALFSSNNQKT